MIILFLSSVIAYGQNQAPIAVNDTIFISYEDSIYKVAFQLMNNDYDPNGDTLAFDTISYNGTNQVSFIEISTNHFRFSRIIFEANPDFAGWDSIQYTIRDVATPTLYDTAMFYIFVVQKSYEILNLNNIEATIDVDMLFFDRHTNKASFKVPKETELATIFEVVPWVAGKNNNIIYATALSNPGGYYGTLDTPYRKGGPISNNYEGLNFHLKWDRVWKVTNIDLQYHIANWFYPNYQPPQVFLDWPAHGDTTNGQAFYLAPFIDKNNDGIYNPYDGDYPQFKGQQAIFFINNDQKYLTSHQPMGLEIHGMAYVYNCPSDSAIHHSLFLDLAIYNRSNNTFDSTYVGLFTDFDIGNPQDDYVGCDVNRSTFYGYNGDAFDEDNQGVTGYGTYIPYQGVTFLKGVKQDNDGIDNAFGIAPYESVNGVGFGDGITDNEHWGMEHFMGISNISGVFDPPWQPFLEEYFFYLLSGRWHDGSYATYGNNGHLSSGGTIKTNYLFPDNSDTYSYGTNGMIMPSWTEFNTNFNFPNTAHNRIGIGSSGPFTFAPQQSVELTMAFVFGRDYTTQGNFAGLPIMQERIDSIRSYFLNDFQSVCGGTLINSINDEVERTEKQLVIYPNPFNNQFTLEYETENQSAYLAIYNLMGVKVVEQTINSSKTVVDVSNISDGIYFVVIQDGSNRLHHKIVKQ
ncbi:MAG: T9SS type A sorting domain-containing protein [Vicingaceae bacterium]|nr:T9SS type A sorting domain-containing protein [Vicingaceae bacterium]